MKREKNKNTLNEALRRLPRYEPATDLWSQIENRVEADRQQNKLQKALRTLPGYEPPDQTWEGIEKRLMRGRRRQLWRRAVSIAAVLGALAVALGRLYYAQASPASVTVSYHREEAPATPAIDWEADADAIALIQREYARQPAFAAAPNHYQLLEELEELEAARNELADAVARYGADSHLLREIHRIEQQRTDILEEMAAQI